MFLRWSVVYFFFFFQAEDGIRDRNVTGVQTCALPISRWYRPASSVGGRDNGGCRPVPAWRPTCRDRAGTGTRRRSEERRVGKEWRNGRGAECCKKKCRTAHGKQSVIGDVCEVTVCPER